MIGPRLLYTAAVLFAAGGAALRAAPVTLPEAPRAAGPQPPSPAEPGRAPPMEQQRYATIVAGNVFAAGRAAPATRFVPEGFRRDTAPAPRTPTKRPEPVAKLFGITRGPAGAVALIDADPQVPGAEVYRIGDAVRGAVISDIGETTVTLRRPSGPLVLRLPDAGDRR